MLKNTLEIILITYNRKPYLEKTFKRLLAENSPVKALQITVLDNCSSDGTSEYLSDLSKKYTNIKHIRHNRNIGANANIARAFEIATKPYLWILADDDDFDFTDFNQVQEALLNETPALLIVAPRGQNLPLHELLRNITFLPSVIFSSALLTEETMLNIHINIPNWYPHLPPIIKAFNEEGKIITLKKDFVLINPKSDSYNIFKKLKGVFPEAKNLFTHAAYLNTISLLKPSLRKNAAENFQACKYGFFKQAFYYFKQNAVENENCLRNVISPMPYFTFSQKLRWCLAYFVFCADYIIRYRRFKKKINSYKQKYKQI